MAVLSDTNRADVWAEFMRQLSLERESLNVVKADLRAAVNAVDDWVETNKTAFNLALPIISRTNLTAAQKARLLSFVVTKRFVTGA